MAPIQSSRVFILAVALDVYGGARSLKFRLFASVLLSYLHRNRF